MSKADSAKLVPGIIKKLIRNSNDTYAFPHTLTRTELSLIACLSNYLVAKPAFDADRLYDDFATTLKSHGLLRKEELTQFEQLKAGLTLYAVAIMHRCRIRIDNVISTELTAVGHKGAHIDVCSAISTDIASSKTGTIKIACAIFSTELKTESNCEPDLLAAPAPWDFELEVNGNMRLGRLQ